MRRAWRRAVWSVVLVVGLSTSGCGTLVSSAQTWPRPDFFGGVRYDARVMAEPGPGEYPAFGLFDMPMSVVLDIGFLPFNSIFQMGHWLFGEQDAKPR
ncbi:MAG: hypothetical protein KDC38_08665 [Planctomycetes bacterium]|nr:hypothetical protein [Planctomycetota bacterium]